MDPDGDADDVGGHGDFGLPLPPDDRLWRHPSELAALADPGAAATTGTTVRASGTSWQAVVAAGLVGAVLATGVLVATGALGSQVVERTVIERVAMSPVVSSPMLRGDLGVVALTDRVSPSIGAVEVTAGDDVRTGTAVAFRSDGHLLTSATLVEGAVTVTVVLGGRRLAAEVVGADPLTDVAVVAVDATDLPLAVLATGDPLQVGQPTVTLGAPTNGSPPVVTTGVVSALGKRVDRQGADALHGLIQIDTATPDGGLGAPVLDSSGSVIGLATVSGDGTLGFAVPVHLARRVAEDLVLHGAAQHCWLGISGIDVDPAAADVLGVAGGTVVQDVTVGSPAHGAGLAEGDVVTEVDGEALRGVSHLVAELRERRPGERVSIGYWRDGRHHEVEVDLAARP
jgi:S1-C subfamily serine protease